MEYALPLVHSAVAAGVVRTATKLIAMGEWSTSMATPVFTSRPGEDVADGGHIPEPYIGQDIPAISSTNTEFSASDRSGNAHIAPIT